MNNDLKESIDNQSVLYACSCNIYRYSFGHTSFNILCDNALLPRAKIQNNV